MTMLVVSHEMKFAREVATKIILMADGNIIEEAAPQRFFEDPKEERTRRFLRQINEI
ncbi:putative amino-acid import ATP-binding protein YxeO [compost metagenome]